MKPFQITIVLLSQPVDHHPKSLASRPIAPTGGIGSLMMEPVSTP